MLEPHMEVVGVVGVSIGRKADAGPDVVHVAAQLEVLSSRPLVSESREDKAQNPFASNGRYYPIT
jgi:hypothetical protein